jgi:transposase
MKLLADLCKNIEQPLYQFGRPKLPLSDMVFASALKVYSTFSLRRFISQMQKALAEGYVDSICSYSSVSNFMRRKEITPILYDLIRISSLPLASAETTFAVDSSGFSTSRFGRYFSYKHGKERQHKVWIKAHICCGVHTNIITAVDLNQDSSNDYPFFKPLVEKTAMAFEVKEVTADKAYSGRDNLQFVEGIGGTAFIPFKTNAKGWAKTAPAWRRMYNYFMLYNEDFMKHYHKRSNVETTFHMIKSKFRDHVRSKDQTAQFNEVLLKILCHNICVVIQEMHELGIQADFVTARSQV